MKQKILKECIRLLKLIIDRLINVNDSEDKKIDTAISYIQDAVNEIEDSY